MNSRNPSYTRACPQPEEIMAFIMDGASTSTQDLAEHIESCESCHRLATEMRTTRNVLQQDHDMPSRDFTSDILAKLPADTWQTAEQPAHRRKLLYWRGALGLAATLAMLLGAIHLLRESPREPDVMEIAQDPIALALHSGRQWLLQNQMPNGGWDVAALGGQPDYTEALNGLAVLAITAGNTVIPPQDSQALLQAAAYLLSHQNKTGLISQNANAAMYNHGIATLALLDIHRITADENLMAPIEKALTHIYARQTPSGGWGYHAERDSAPNTSITTWQVKTLLQARAQGWPVPTEVIRNAIGWLTGTMGPQGYFGYERPQQFPEGPTGLTLMGAYCLFAAKNAGIMTALPTQDTLMTGLEQLTQQAPADFHQAYFYAAAMEQMDRPAYLADLQSVRTALANSQIRTGPDAGAWTAAGDRWGKPGGNLYSTTFAMLALIQE